MAFEDAVGGGDDVGVIFLSEDFVEGGSGDFAVEDEVV